MKTRWLAVLAFALAGSAWADDDHAGRPHTHWWLEMDWSSYAGASIAQSKFDGWQLPLVDPSFTPSSSDDSDTGFRVFAGVEVGRYLGLELGYADFGEVSRRLQNDGSGSFFAAGPVTDSLSLEAYDLTLVGRLPLTANLALLGKAGLFWWDSSYRLDGTAQCCGPGTYFRDSEDGSDAVYGAGVRYERFRPWVAVAEYTRGDFDGESLGARLDREVETLALSLSYKFWRSQ